PYFRAAAFPPLRPAATFCACVPPCEELLRFFDSPPCFDASGELAMRAARSFDMPLSFSASYCFSFLTLALLPGMTGKCPLKSRFNRCPEPRGDVGLRVHGRLTAL